MSHFSLLFITAALYAGLGVYFWRGLWRPLASPEARWAWEKPAVLAPLGLHAILLYQSMFQAGSLNFSVGNALSAVAWLTVMVYCIGSLRSNLEGLQGFVLPFAALSIGALLLPTSHVVPEAGFSLFGAHFLVALLAYTMFTVAGLHALLMAISERQLHSRHFSKLLKRLPPLLTMERLLFQIIWAGFILLTFALASGVLFSEVLWGKPMQFSHKTLFALISWGIFATLLAGRHFYGWRGRRAVLWTLSGCVSLFLAYIGSKFVLEILLGR